MECNAERDMLKRIIALLFALAGLADRAGALSRPARCLVLGILRPAEAVARAYVIGRDLDAPPQARIAALTFTHVGDDPADAARLALRFRALAFVLASLPARGFANRRADPPANRPGLHPVHGLRDIVNALRGFGCRTLRQPFPDTS